MLSEPNLEMGGVDSKPTITSNGPQPKVKHEEFSPSWSLYISLGTLSIIGLAASIDGTSISPALPVPISNSSPNLTAQLFLDHRRQTSRLRSGGILGRDIFQTHGDGFPAELCMLCERLWAQAYDHACDHFLHNWFHRFRCRQ